MSQPPPFYDDPRVLQIPIHECNEDLIDIRTEAQPYIQMLPDPSTPFEDMEHNAGLKYSSFIRLGLFQRLKAAALNMTKMFKDNGQDKEIVFLVFEGMRNKNDYPTEYHPHKATGGCVSFRVYDSKSSSFLDMGEMHPETFSKFLTDTQRSNRNMLVTAAMMAGLVNYPYEWWTFCFGTQYFSFLTQNKFSIYGPLSKDV